MVGIRTLSLALLALALLPASAAATPTTQIIVKREPGLSAAERADIRADADVRFVETLPLPGTEVVAAEPGDVSDAVRDLNADRDVVYAERDRTIHAADDPEIDDMWGLQRIQAPASWARSTGFGSTVAVIDTGVDASHPDLADRVITGYDWVDGDTDADDPVGHGTHVAGTVAAMRDGLGNSVAGVAHDAQILPLRVLKENGEGLVSDLIKAYDFAGDHGVRIVNASLGGIGSLRSESDAIARNPEVLFVVAAGNGDDPDDDPPYEGDDNDNPAVAQYPCAYKLPNILCVGASDSADEAATFSNYGQTTVDVFAPGVDIRSTIPGGGWDERSGTSMATPHVAGLSALLLSQTPELTPAKVIDAVVEWADPVRSLAGKAVDGGRVNAYATVEFNDDDADTTLDRDDNCPVTSNPGQADADRDGFGDVCDLDSDGDARNNDADNCPTVSNAGQADTDHDGVGDVCDTSPRGHDNDRDGKSAVDDSCPTVYGTLANGCPAPLPPPPNADGDNRFDSIDACPTEYAISNDGCPVAQVVALSPKVKKRSATVTVSTTRAASVTITVQRKKGRRWVRVASKTRATVANKTSLTVKRLKRGAHRVKVSISSSGGAGAPRTKSFRVR